MLVQHTVTTSNVYSIFFRSTESKVSDTQVRYSDAGWSPKGGQSGADTWGPSCRCGVQVSTHKPRVGSLLLGQAAPLLTGGQGEGTEEATPDCHRHRPPGPTDKDFLMTRDPELFYFNCKLL